MFHTDRRLHRTDHVLIARVHTGPSLPEGPGQLGQPWSGGRPEARTDLTRRIVRVTYRTTRQHLRRSTDGHVQQPGHDPLIGIEVCRAHFLAAERSLSASPLESRSPPCQASGARRYPPLGRISTPAFSMLRRSALPDTLNCSAIRVTGIPAS